LDLLGQWSDEPGGQHFSVIVSAELSEKPAFELKARMTSFTILRLLSGEVTTIEKGLRAKIQQAPKLFLGAPFVIDVSAIPSVSFDLPALIKALRALQVTPVGIRGGDPALKPAASDLNLGWFDWSEDTGRLKTVRVPAKAPEAVKRPAPEPSLPTQDAAPEIKKRSATKIVAAPVRSGQSVYARNGDLLVLSPVSPGAELIADGHIHVYGALRGRALAGAQGDEEARLFCRSLEAELVAVAGTYMVSEEFDRKLRGKPVQVYMKNNKLVVEAL
jgi:septum site-determining protein MinC